MASDGDLQCNKLKEFFQNRKKNKNKKKTIQKLDDLQLANIYVFLYIAAFLLFISLSMDRAIHIDHEPPNYLPLDLTCQHVFLEAVQRSRCVKKAKKNTKFPLIKKYIKKTRFDKENILIFKKGYLNV